MSLPIFSSHVQLNYVAFQVVKYNATSKKATEVHTVSLAVFPSYLSYTYPSRAAIEQTVEDKDGIGGFRDEPGRGLAQVTIRGTMGYWARREGVTLKSGWQRLREFRELIVKLSHVVPGGKLSADQSLVLNALADDEVICLNFYDFLNDERFAVDVRSFNILETMQSNRLPQYTITLQEVGPVVKTDGFHGLLSGLLVADTLYGTAITQINEALGWVIGGPLVGLELLVGLVEGVEGTISSSLGGLLSLTSTVQNVLSGTTPVSAISTGNIENLTNILTS
jgi:hypothetical protein